MDAEPTLTRAILRLWAIGTTLSGKYASTGNADFGDARHYRPNLSITNQKASFWCLHAGVLLFGISGRHAGCFGVVRTGAGVSAPGRSLVAVRARTFSPATMPGNLRRISLAVHGVAGYSHARRSASHVPPGMLLQISKCRKSAWRCSLVPTTSTRKDGADVSIGTRMVAMLRYGVRSALTACRTTGRFAPPWLLCSVAWPPGARPPRWQAQGRLLARGSPQSR